MKNEVEENGASRAGIFEKVTEDTRDSVKPEHDA